MATSRTKRWLVALAALPALAVAAWVGHLAWIAARTVRAVFLPYNFQHALHSLEVGLLAAAGFGLILAIARRPSASERSLRLPDGREVPLRGTLVVGSGADCDVVVPGALVSRRHLAIHSRADGRLEVSDLGSTNGTFREDDDLRGRGRVALRPGDRLRMGRGAQELEVVEHVAGGRWLQVGTGAASLLFLWVGLFLGWRANLDRLPQGPVPVGGVTIDFAPFRSPWPMLSVALAAGVLIWALTATGRAGWRRPRSRVAASALTLFLTVGAVVLYPLLPASGWRYAEAAVRALGDVGLERWRTLETWEERGGRPERLLRGEATAEELELPADERETVVRRYAQGRAALRWASNLGAERGDPWWAITYFRQVAALLAAALLALWLPARWPALGARLARLPDRLSRAVSRRLVRLADGGALWARFLRPVAYWDVLFGFAAAAVVAITLWTPLGTTLGRGKSLYLELPGIATIQSVEIVKALFVLFMAGYFARHGAVLAKAPRRRYVVPYLLAVLITLALTGVQADLGGLFMLGLFLALVFVAATGSWRLVASVPLLILPGIALAWALGLTSIIGTRLGIWLDPRSHPLGEQIVQARQLFLASGWSGYPAYESRAWLLPDVQGDLVIAALAERFGLVGLLALVAAWFAFGASLLASARHADRSRAILLASVAAVVLVQVLTQVGGAMGLLPLTGVPVPWISHGLTASLVFTVLSALAIHAFPDRGPSRPGRSFAPTAAGDSVVHLRRIHAAACLALAAAAVYWTVWLPSRPEVGPLGADYRWQSRERTAELERWTSAGLFVAGGRGVEIDPAAYQRYVTAADDPGLLRLIATADGLSMVDGELRARTWLTTNPNRFADRSPARGWIWSADGAVLAMNDRHGRRLHPLGAAAFHPVGFAGGSAQALGVEAAARRLLRGEALDDEMRRQAFWNDVHSGPELVLTLRAPLQREAHRLLDGRRGAVVVMDLRDGALLAAASSPAPETGDAAVADWLRFARAGDQPLRNRAFYATDVYSPPGSVFKIVVAAAVLGHRETFDPRRTVRCQGYDGELRVACAHGTAHGRIALERALRVSCNVYFARAAVALGIDNLRETVARFGFNPRAPLDLAPAWPAVRLSSGISQVLPDPDVRLKDRDLARVGYGQGPVSATPLDVARMGAVIAGGGAVRDPYLVRALSYSRRGSNGLPERVWQREAAEPAARRVLPESVARRIEKTLRGVFESADGTARSLPHLWRGPDGWRLDRESPGDGWRRVAMAGKTGSAWKTRGDVLDDAWMVAWAPAGEARVVAAVLVEDAGEGGKVAGPIAVAILADALHLLDGFPRIGDDDVSNQDV